MTMTLTSRAMALIHTCSVAVIMLSIPLADDSVPSPSVLFLLQGYGGFGYMMRTTSGYGNCMVGFGAYTMS